jgi:hypothetical protein
MELGVGGVDVVVGGSGSGGGCGSGGGMPTHLEVLSPTLPRYTTVDWPVLFSMILV